MKRGNFHAHQASDRRSVNTASPQKGSCRVNSPSSAIALLAVAARAGGSKRADHPLRQILPMVNQALGQMDALCSLMRVGLQRRRQRRTSQHRPGEADPGDALAGVLQRALGAHADGADLLGPVVS